MISKEILFRISRPYKVYSTQKVAAVVIPAVKGDVTILPERAPTMFLLRNGIVQILDNHLKPLEKYFVKGGLADVARNRCAISAEKVFSVDTIDIAKAERKRDDAMHNEDKAFYQMVIDELKLINR